MPNLSNESNDVLIINQNIGDHDIFLNEDSRDVNNPMYAQASALISDIEAYARLPLAHPDGIPERIRNNYELFLAKHHPDKVWAENCLHTYITPQGLYQHQAEVGGFVQILSCAVLQTLGFHDLLQKTDCLNEHEVFFLNDKISHSAWLVLEKAVIEHNGHTVLGYSVNEEVFLFCWGQMFQLYYKAASVLGYPARSCEYPPRVDDGEKVLLNWIQKEWMRDMSMSVRVAGFTMYLTTTIMLNSSNLFRSGFKSEFYENNFYYFLASGIALSTIAKLLLHYSSKKEEARERLQQFFLITKSLAGYTNSLSIYGTLFLSPFFEQSRVVSMLGYGFIPVSLYAVYQGIRHKKLYNDNYPINIANAAEFNMFFLALGYAINDSTFARLGLMPIMSECYAASAPTVTRAMVHQEMTIIKSVQFMMLGLAFVIHLMRYPKIPHAMLHRTGRYGSNMLNGLSFVLCDAYAFLAPGFNGISQTNTTQYSIAQSLVNLIFLSIIYICAFQITYVNTPNLPDLSVRPGVKKDNALTDLCHKTYRFFSTSIPKTRKEKAKESCYDGDIELVSLSFRAPSCTNG